MALTIDVDRARAETPGCRNVVHFNNAGAALAPAPVLDAVVHHLERESQIGGYEAASEAGDRLGHTYHAVARLLGCGTDEVALTENATRAWDMAFYAMSFGPGDRILTARAEYASNAIALLHMARRTGAVIDVIPDDEAGQLSVSALAERLDDPRVRLVAITHVPTQGGLVNPVEAVGRLTRQAGVPFLLDACQAVGQMPVDVEALGCDVLSGTGRKFLRGPRGTGFLYVRRSLLESLDPPLLDLHAAEWVAPDRYEIRDDARRFESWEYSAACRLGLGVAVDYALGWGLDAIEARVVDLAAQLRAALGDVPGVDVHDRGARLCAIVTFTVDGFDAADVAARLVAGGINVSVSGAASARYDLPERGLDTLVRASVHYYNTTDEIDRLVTEVAAIAADA